MRLLNSQGMQFVKVGERGEKQHLLENNDNSIAAAVRWWGGGEKEKKKNI